MADKNNLSRITIDIPTVEHKRLKSISVLTGKSMRSIVADLIEAGLKDYKEQPCQYSHIPNKKTKQAIEDTKKENSTRYKNSADLFKKLGM